MTDVLPTVDDVEEAGGRLRDWLIATPVLESDVLNQRAGTRVLVKAESLQFGGSFKVRGALNRLLQLSYNERSAGVVAFSSGNHAQGVALAAKWLGARATIVMPKDAPKIKQFNTRTLGAEVVLYDRRREDREHIAAQLAAERGAALVPTLVTYEMIDRHGEAQGVPENNLRKIRQAKAKGAEALRIAREAGLTIGSGSDLLGAMQPFKTTELSLKAEVIGAMGAIVSATATNARIFGLADDIGTVEEGKQADLIAVAGNPVDDITVLETAANVRLVVKQGSVAKRLEL